MALKRTGFKRKTYDEIVSKQAAKRHKMPQVKSKPKKVAKSPQKGYKPPKWFSSLPLGSHGSTPAQKKYWKVISDTYRKEDFEKYNARCPICTRPMESWQQLQLGHFHRWSLCNAWFKFERKNLLSICAGCNQNDGGLTSIKFSERLKEKYGEDIIDWIETENEKYRGQKMEVWEIVDKVAQLRPDLIE